MTPRPIVIQTAEAGPVWCWRDQYDQVWSASRIGAFMDQNEWDGTEIVPVPEKGRRDKCGNTPCFACLAICKHRELAKGVR